jgi:ABC-type sugar transport system ATPase subunit
MITHTLEDVFAIGDRVIVMRLGRINMDERVTDITQEDIVSHMVGAATLRPRE